MDSIPCLHGVGGQNTIYCEGACQAAARLCIEHGNAGTGIYEENSDKTIVVGPRNTIPDKPKDKIILHGNCTKRFADKGMWIPGCPPGETGLYPTIQSKEGQVVDGEIPGCIENIIRPSMEADHPKWRAYVEQKAKEFYENPENQ